MAGRVLITGSSGYLGSRAVAILASKGFEVFGIDVKDPADSSKLVGFVKGSVADRSKMDEVFELAKPDIAVNLAFVVDPTHNESREEEIALTGGGIFLDECASRGVGKVVYVTSVAAYGAFPDNDLPLTEESRVRGVKGYSYSRLKALADDMVTEFMRTHGETATVILRPCLFVGKHTVNRFFDILGWPLVPRVWDSKGVRDPEFQFIGEDDMAGCLAAAVEKDVRGVYNVAAEGSAKFSDLIRRAGKRGVPIPSFILYPFARLLWHLRLIAAPPAQLDFIRYPWIMDASRMQRELYTPKKGSVEAFDDFLSRRP